MDNAKLPLPKFLKLLTDNNVPVSTAMGVAGKIYKEYNTPAQLRELNEARLIAAGITEKNARQLIMTALCKVGYVPGRGRATLKRKVESDDQPPAATTSTITHNSATKETFSPKRKRKYKDINELLPEPKDESAEYDALSFNEVLDEQNLETKAVVINRAPVMMAWAAVIAERLGFKREEALSIASVYTEMNAVSKGVSLGIYEQGKEKGRDAEREGSQPYVELMGRRPLFKTLADQWRAMTNGTPASPGQAYSYITRSFRQTTPYIIGALSLLANSFTPDELNAKAWELYAQFRPSAEGWGKRAEMKCSVILSLRKVNEGVSIQQTTGIMQSGGQKNEGTKPVSVGKDESSL